MTLKERVSFSAFHESAPSRARRLHLLAAGSWPPMNSRGWSTFTSGAVEPRRGGGLGLDLLDSFHLTHQRAGRASWRCSWHATTWRRLAIDRRVRRHLVVRPPIPNSTWPAGRAHAARHAQATRAASREPCARASSRRQVNQWAGALKVRLLLEPPWNGARPPHCATRGSVRSRCARRTPTEQLPHGPLASSSATTSCTLK